MLERQVEADERSAAGLEQLAQQGDRQGELEQLRELVERQQQQIDGMLRVAGDVGTKASPSNLIPRYRPVKPRRRAEA
jgi:hypothetical protein